MMRMCALAVVMFVLFWLSVCVEAIKSIICPFFTHKYSQCFLLPLYNLDKLSDNVLVVFLLLKKKT